MLLTSRFHSRACLVVSIAAIFCLGTAPAAPADAPAEPNVEVASAWWPEMENTWVSIGWKDHPLRFNVLDDGTLIAQPVCLWHEISSCEPCYSWNVFHAWQAGDRPKFLEGLYSLLTGSMSRRTSIGCEHRGGVSGTLFSVPLPIELARLSVIDDQRETARLHLLRLVPLAWLRADRPATFERIATEFGPVTLGFQVEQNGRRLRVAFEPQFRHEPQSISLHVPPLDGLSEIAVGDRVHATHPGDVIALK